MLQTNNMKIFRRAGLFLSLLLAPALVLYPAPAHAVVYPAGSLDTSWATGGYAGIGNELFPAEKGFITDEEGGVLFPVSFDNGPETGIGISAIDPNGNDEGIFASLPDPVGYTYLYPVSLDFDFQSNAWVLFFQTSRGLAISRFSKSGALDYTFGESGISFPAEMINDAIGDLGTMQISANQIQVESRLSFSDMAVSQNGSVFLLGSIRAYGLDIPFEDGPMDLPLNGHPLNSDLVLWKIQNDGILDTGISSDQDEGRKFTANLTWQPGIAAQGSSQLVFNTDRNKLTVLAVVPVSVDDLLSQEYFLQRFEVSGNSFQDLEVLGEPFFVSDLGWDTSFTIYESIETVNGDLLIAGQESSFDSPHVHGTVFRFNAETGAFVNLFTSEVNNENCSYSRIAIDEANQIFVSGSCWTDTSEKPSLLKLQPSGQVDSSFRFTQTQWGNGPFFDPYGLTVVGTRVLAIGWAGDRTANPCGSSIEISGCALNLNSDIETGQEVFAQSASGASQIYGTAFRASSLTVPDPPVPAPAPAPVIAPALPTQSAPVAVPATVKAKKKLSFPLVSSAGNTLIVGVSGSCSLSPVFKKVKVKVGKKTKKVKQQTGWTVQMKKKKQTCTITQTDSGGNGYAALSSTATVTIK